MLPLWTAPFIVFGVTLVLFMLALTVWIWFDGRNNHIADIKETKRYGYKADWYLNTYKSRWFSGVYNLGWRSAKNWKRSPTSDDIKERNKARLEGKPKPVQYDPNDVIGDM